MTFIIQSDSTELNGFKAEWKMDSGSYLFLITMGGRQSVQHIFTLSSSLGRPRVRAKQVLKIPGFDVLQNIRVG